MRIFSIIGSLQYFLFSTVHIFFSNPLSVRGILWKNLHSRCIIIAIKHPSKPWGVLFGLLFYRQLDLGGVNCIAAVVLDSAAIIVAIMGSLGGEAEG